MRTIPESIQTLLKSRSMIGANKPAYEISIDGLGGAYDWDTANAWVTPDTSKTDKHHLSAATKSDGTLLVSRMINRQVCVGECVSMDALAAGDDTITTWTPTGIAVNTDQNGSAIFRLENGYATDGLYMIVADIGLKSTYQETVRIYKSASGDGDDFALYGTIVSRMPTNDLSSCEGDMLGIPIVLPSGRWVTIARHRAQWFSVDIGYVGVAYSDDDGVSWTYSTSIIFNVGSGSGDYFIGSSKKIYRSTAGNLYIAATDYYGACEIHIQKSTDGGVTWGDPTNISIGSFGNYSTANISFETDADGSLLVFFSNGENKVWRFPDPDASLANYELIATLPGNSKTDSFFTQKVGDDLALFYDYKVLGLKGEDAVLPVKSISIQRNKNMAAQCDIVIDNAGGSWWPDGTTHYHILWPNKEVTVKLGYGTEMVSVFTGLIDRVEGTTFPQEISISCRDMKLLIEQTVTNGTSHVLTYTNAEVSTIVSDLITKSGATAGTIETTTLTLPTITFSWCNYMEAISQLCGLTCSMCYADEDGKINFVADSETSTTADYSYSEGVDIRQLSYVLDDSDLFRKVAVYGDGHFYASTYSSADYYGVLNQRFLKIDAAECNTAALCQTVGDKTVALMESRARVCTFEVPGNPWMQIGDLAEIIETSTTINEVYKIIELGHSFTPDGGMWTTFTCYHYSA